MSIPDITNFSISFNRDGARQLVDAVEAASRPPQVMWTGNLEGMKAEAEEKKTEHLVNLLRTLKQSGWWESIKEFSGR